MLSLKKKKKARCQWLTPAILPTQEAEIRSTAVWNQDSRETLSWKKPITKKGWWSGSRCRPWVQTAVLQKKPQKTKTKTKCIYVHYTKMCVYIYVYTYTYMYIHIHIYIHIHTHSFPVWANYKKLLKQTEHIKPGHKSTFFWSGGISARSARDETQDLTHARQALN
jgi:hypothetical protein